MNLLKYAVLTMLCGLMAGCNCYKQRPKISNEQFINCHHEAVLYADLSQGQQSQRYYTMNGEVCSE